MYRHPYDQGPHEDRGHEMLAYVLILVIFTTGFIAGALLV